MMMLHGRPTARVSIGVDVETLPRFASMLRDALEIVQLAHRRSARRVGVDSLRLHRVVDLPSVLPPLSFQIAAASSGVGVTVRCERLCEVTLCQCLLPPKLGCLLAHVQSLRLWDCPLSGGRHYGDEGAVLVQTLATVPLSTLVWTSERQPIPIELLETPRDRPLHHLVLSASQFEGDASSELSEGVGWSLVAGDELRTLALLTPSPLSLPLARSLALALPCWCALHTLRMGPDALSSLCHAHPAAADGAGAIAILRALPPTLSRLGVVDCSWLSPTWFFDALAIARADACAHGVLPSLSELHIFVNSPGACVVGDPRELMHMGAEGWSADAFGADCALRTVAVHLAAALPALEALVVEWYEEDETDAAGFVDALAPLSACARLRSLTLLRHSAECARLQRGGQPLNEEEVATLTRESLARADAHTEAHTTPTRQPEAHPSAAPAAPRELHVSVHYEPKCSRASQPVWELEDEVGLLPCCARLVPLAELPSKRESERERRVGR